jgi:hypothetical protein
MSVNRRDFLRSVASISGALASTTSFGQTETIQQLDASLPSPELSGIEHVVVVMMENRSFDHLLGWMPNANGRQAGLEYPDNLGTTHPTYRLTDFVGCSHPDPDHSYAGGRSEYNSGWREGASRLKTLHGMRGPADVLTDAGLKGLLTSLTGASAAEVTDWATGIGEAKLAYDALSYAVAMGVCAAN